MRLPVNHVPAKRVYPHTRGTDPFQPAFYLGLIAFQLQDHPSHVFANIRRADVGEEVGWVVLELDGEETEIERGLEWVSSTGVRVDPLGGDVIDG